MNDKKLKVDKVKLVEISIVVEVDFVKGVQMPYLWNEEEKDYIHLDELFKQFKGKNVKIIIEVME